MSDFTFDTHAEIRKPEQSGIPVPHAEAVVDMVTRAPINTQVAEGLGRLKGLERHLETNMATRADHAVVAASLERLEGHVETNMATRADIAAVAANLERLERHVEANMATKADLTAVAANLERLERHVETNMATRADLATLRTETKAGLTALRADLYRALWLQGGALAGLILVLAGYALTS